MLDTNENELDELEALELDEPRTKNTQEKKTPLSAARLHEVINEIMDRNLSEFKEIRLGLPNAGPIIERWTKIVETLNNEEIEVASKIGLPGNFSKQLRKTLLNIAREEYHSNKRNGIKDVSRTEPLQRNNLPPMSINNQMILFAATKFSRWVIEGGVEVNEYSERYYYDEEDEENDLVESTEEERLSQYETLSEWISHGGQEKDADEHFESVIFIGDFKLELMFTMDLMIQDILHAERGTTEDDADYSGESFGVAMDIIEENINPMDTELAWEIGEKPARQEILDDEQDDDDMDNDDETEEYEPIDKEEASLIIDEIIYECKNEETIDLHFICSDESESVKESCISEVYEMPDGDIEMVMDTWKEVIGSKMADSIDEARRLICRGYARSQLLEIEAECEKLYYANKAKIAKDLRKRQLKKKLTEKKILAMLSDDDIIECYVQCHQCKEIFVDPAILKIVILNSKNGYKFIQNTEDMKKCDC